MFSVPPAAMVEMYRARLGTAPRSLFDCGAATGEIVHRAHQIGLRASGVDIKQYPIPPAHQKYFDDGRIQIKSILDCAPVRADIAYCNGTLTYMNETTLPLVLERFKNVKMLIAIHNTTEDIDDARARGEELLTVSKVRLTRPVAWWMDTFDKNGFDTDFDSKYNCFCAIPRARHR